MTKAHDDLLRNRAVKLWQAGLAAADSVEGVVRALGQLDLAQLAPQGRVFVLAVGKAAGAMCEAAIAEFSKAGLTAPEAMVVTNYENSKKVNGASVWLAGHPVPDENGAAAGREVVKRLTALGPQDHLLALISGGGSALLPAPVVGVSLADKIEVNRLLLASGVEIRVMNAIRQQLSQLKGGGMLRLAAPAAVTALLLSDVVGDDLRAIASGPTTAPLATRSEVRAMLHALKLWDRVPTSVRSYLERPVAPLSELPPVDNRLIGSNELSVTAMVAAGATPAPAPLVGDVDAAAREVWRAVRDLPPGAAMVFGGETTVSVRGEGMGGRCQELALRLALLAEADGRADDWAFLAAGTDGRDGPTEAAGGLVDGESLTALRAAGIDPAQALANNNSYTALSYCNGLFLTGATGTNVADLSVFVRR